jgi:two-component SAPR family response regulator
MQKLLYAIIMAAKKLQHYFTEHEESVVTSFPLGEVVRNRDAVGWISKWAVELMGYDVKFVPRTAIKSQALSDFIAVWRKSKPRPQKSPTSIGPSTSMRRSWDPARGPGSS